MVRVVDHIEAIGATAWNACAGTEHPFTQFAFFKALEQTQCVGEHAGWYPQYLVLSHNTSEDMTPDTILGVCPAFVKTHSQGEYVFDHGWADAFERAGGRYYPKLQVSVPFSPVTGPRLLVPGGAHQADHKRALAEGLKSLTKKLTLSSIHATFLQSDDLSVLTHQDYLIREDRQFHWSNAGYEDFAGFLSTLNSRKRKDLRKERAQAVENGLSIHWLSGTDLTEDVWRAFYTFYMDTGQRKWGTPYLNLDFFLQLSEDMADQIVLIMAQRAGKWIAGAMNMVGSDTLYGRYWGCIEYHPCLHFEVCYYQAIDYAIAHGLSRVEAGAQGGHKMARGYVPTPTYSAHWFPHAGFQNAIAHYLSQERDMVALDTARLDRHTPYKKS